MPCWTSGRAGDRSLNHDPRRFPAAASRRAAKTITLISVVTCLAVTGFAAAVHGFTEAPATQPVTATGGDEVPGPSATAPADNGAVPADNTAAPAPMPAPVVADGNTPIGALLRELANGKFDRMVGGKNNRAAFDAYYAAHGYAPIWITDGKFNERAAAAIAYRRSATRPRETG